MTLIEEFREIGYELQQFVKQELDLIKENTLKSINNLEKETKQKIHHDLELLEQNMIHQAEYRLNKQLSDRINQINQTILDKKNQIIEGLITKSQKQLETRISQNPEAYFEFLLISLDHHSNLLDTDCWLQLTARDAKLYLSNSNMIKKFPNFTLDLNHIEDIAGYKIIAKNGMFELDFTFQTLKEKNRAEIARTIMNRFPIFEVKLEDAVEIFDHIKSELRKGDN